MNNGCICCTVRGDLVRILGKITKRKTKLDGVIIEVRAALLCFDAVARARRVRPRRRAAHACALSE